jgi:hypothetical protein
MASQACSTILVPVVRLTLTTGTRIVEHAFATQKIIKLLHFSSRYHHVYGSDLAALHRAALHTEQSGVAQSSASVLVHKAARGMSQVIMAWQNSATSELRICTSS